MGLHLHYANGGVLIMDNKQKLIFCRQLAKKQDMTVKRMTCTINNMQAYKLVRRGTNDNIVSLCTISSILERLLFP